MTNLERIRREKRMTQKWLTIKSGIEQCRISAFETLRADIDKAKIETVGMLAKALDVKAWDILNDKELIELLQNACVGEEKEHDDWFDGTRTLEMRKRMKMTQKEVSDETYIAQCQISKFERFGVENARIETICRLCISLDCVPCDLIDDRVTRELLRGVL